MQEVDHHKPHPARARPATSGPATQALSPWIQLAGFDDGLSTAIGALEREPEPRVTSLDDESRNSFPAGIEGKVPDVLAVGPHLSAENGRALLERCLGDPRFGRTRMVVVGSGSDSPFYYDLLAADRLYFLAPGHLDTDWTAALLAGALEASRTVRGSDELPLEGGNDGSGEPLDNVLADIFGAQDPQSLVERTARMLERLLDAGRVDGLRYDPDEESLSSARLAAAEETDVHSAAVGTAGLALRTGRSIRFDAIGDSPCFDEDLDERPNGDGSSRFLALPIESSGAAMVWLAWRDAEQPSFTDTERRRAAEALGPLTPVLLQIAERQSKSRRARREDRGRVDSRLSFRSQALEHYNAGLPEHGQVLRISPEWTRYAYPLILVLLMAAAIFSVVGHIHEYAEGVALVRLDGRIDVTAPVAGTVSTVAGRDGRTVSEGDLLVKLYGAQEEAELQRVRREFELSLLERLRRPTDPAAARALGALRVQWQLAASRLEERSVRAPADGVISDLRVETGRLLSPGEVILSLHRQELGRRLLVVLPGKYRPQIEPGMPLRFEPEGFRYAYQHLVVDRVSDEIFGPAEARRILGPVAGDTVPLSGPVMLVEATLPDPVFTSQGRTYEFHDGSLGRAELRIRSEPILLTLIPGLKALWAPRRTDAGGTS